MRYLDADYTDACTVADVRVRRREDFKNLRITTRTLAAQRWDCSIELAGDARLRRDVKRDRRRKGIGTPFALPMPQDVWSIGHGATLPTGTMNVRANADAGAKVVSISVAGGSKRIFGDWYVRFDNHRKVYIVDSDDDDYGGTPKNITIDPPLVEDITQSTKMILEPDLWCVYNLDLTFRDTLAGGVAAHYARFSVSEWLR